MNSMDRLTLYSQILVKAKELGASLVGIANVIDLKKAPSYTVTPLMPPYCGTGADKEKVGNLKSGEVNWPAEAKSVVVIAYAHPEDQPEMDYWYGSIDPIGNKKLIQIVKDLMAWLQRYYGIKAFHLPYHVERGGIYLKDAAVVAGMGCIGKNNLVVSPQYGPRIRLRGLTVDANLPSTGPILFNPCPFCDEICTRSCPEGSFSKKIYTVSEYGRHELPGRTGDYDRLLCNRQMKVNENSALEQQVDDIGKRVRVVRYCRRCEFSCPVGY